MIKNYLFKNLRWQFNQNPYSSLRALATTEEQFCLQLDKLANRYFPERRSIDVTELEFCLNKIALTKPVSEAEKISFCQFRRFWDGYRRLKILFNKNYMEFPSSGSETRVEAVCELIAECTQFAVNGETLTELLRCAREKLELNEREERYIADVLELYKIKYYCALALNVKKEQYAASLARFLEPTLLKFDYFDNSEYRQTLFKTADITAVGDCLGNTLVNFRGINTQISQKLFVYANGRNVFDTFCQSKFGKYTAEFRSKNKTTEIKSRYYLDGNREIRRVSVTNLGATRKFTADVTFNSLSPRKGEYFKMGNALCVAEEGFFAGTALIYDGKMIDAANQNGLSYVFSLKKGETAEFDIATVYALGSPELADALSALENFGATRCPYLHDTFSYNVRKSDIPLSPTPNGCGKRSEKKELAKTIAYSYQLGDDGVATFVDNAGNSATLLNGFVFGVKGESVYSVKYGLSAKLNEGQFGLDADSLRYCRKDGALTITHSLNGKTYDVDYATPSKTLFYFPLEEKSQISFNGKTFSVTDSKRKYLVSCEGDVESYSSNAMECSEEKQRYKLSDNLSVGTCLAICFASAKNVKLKISSLSVSPKSSPIIRESLVSTYLNYVNDKSVFGIKNYLKRPDALTLSAICYTNPEFVKSYILSAYKNGTETTYYDASGNLKKFSDRLALPLACAYYLNLAGDDLPDEIKKAATATVFREEFTGKDLCVKALFLKRAAALEGFDKVKCLVEYNLLKKQIAADAKLYAYAQAIGAVNMYNPSKERLKDLCNKYEIPKNWYYVSQLENLYGLSICDGKLNISPKVTAENVLEQFAIHVKGKHIDTTFYKASVQSMTLNGVRRFQPFCAQNLKNVDNTLEIRY